MDVCVCAQSHIRAVNKAPAKCIARTKKIIGTSRSSKWQIYEYARAHHARTQNNSKKIVNMAISFPVEATDGAQTIQFGRSRTHCCHARAHDCVRCAWHNIAHVRSHSANGGF